MPGFGRPNIGLQPTSAGEVLKVAAAEAARYASGDRRVYGEQLVAREQRGDAGVSMYLDLLTEVYAAFNARDIKRALTAMHPEVDWPNAMEGGYVHGHDGVRDYWIRQWRLIDPHVEPQCFAADDAGRVVVDVHQVVRDRSGRVVTDQMVQHIYVVQDGLVRHMEIRR